MVNIVTQIYRQVKYHVKVTQLVRGGIKIQTYSYWAPKLACLHIHICNEIQWSSHCQIQWLLLSLHCAWCFRSIWYSWCMASLKYFLILASMKSHSLVFLLPHWPFLLSLLFRFSIFCLISPLWRTQSWAFLFSLYTMSGGSHQSPCADVSKFAMLAVISLWKPRLI